jgi:hypothetical protein
MAKALCGIVCSAFLGISCDVSGGKNEKRLLWVFGGKLQVIVWSSLKVQSEN